MGRAPISQLLAAVFFLGSVSAGFRECTLKVCDSTCVSGPNVTALVLSNGFIRIELDISRPSIRSLVADFTGAANFNRVAHEVLAGAHKDQAHVQRRTVANCRPHRA